MLLILTHGVCWSCIPKDLCGVCCASCLFAAGFFYFGTDELGLKHHFS